MGVPTHSDVAIQGVVQSRAFSDHCGQRMDKTLSYLINYCWSTVTIIVTLTLSGLANWRWIGPESPFVIHPACTP